MTSSTSSSSHTVDGRSLQHVEVSRVATEGGSGRAVLRSCSNYAEAQRVLDYLSEHEFPVEKTAIVAHGLALVEQVTRRRSWPMTLLGEIGGGAVMGWLIGLLLGTIVIEPTVLWLELLLWSTAIGAVLGFVFSLVESWFKSGHHDFNSVGAMTAERFDVLVDPDVEAKAKELLSGLV